MELPDGRPLIVEDGILCEPSPEGRVLLWVPGERGEGYQHWDRVGTVAHGGITTAAGISAVEATSVPTRQRLGGRLGTLLHSLTGPRSSRTWTLPGGATVEACGPRQGNLRLAWSADESEPLDETRIKARWPECRGFRRLGRNLVLVSGVGSEPPRAVAEPVADATPPPSESSRALAEQALESARVRGDAHRTVVARIDLGLVLIYEGDSHRAARLFKEALDESRRLGDRALEADALSNFALAAQTLGHSDRARDLLGPVLAYARQVGDRYAETLALDRLAQARLGLGDLAGSLACLEQARGLAAATGDLKHEADLLWRIAIQHADQGRRDPALAAGAAAVACLRRLGYPTADWYALHLANYRTGATPQPLISGHEVAPLLGGSVDTAALTTPAAATRAATDPGLLRMAQTAAKAMAKFVGSGFKTASAEVYRGRLALCATCEHHTGVRCRVCGCITAAKARLLHERCPAGRWPV